MVWWLENDQPGTPEQLALWLDQLSRATLELALGQKGEKMRKRQVGC